MSYIQNSLGAGERIVALAHFHWWYDVKSWLALLLPLALVMGVIAFVPDSVLREPFLYGALALLTVGFIVFLQRMIEKWTTEIGITSHRFVKKSGLFSLRT